MASRGGSCLSAWKDGVAAHKVIEVVCSARIYRRQFWKRHLSQGNTILAGGIEDACSIVVSVCGRADSLELRELKVGQFRASLEGVLKRVVVVYARQFRKLD